MSLPANEAEYRIFMRAFESGTIPKEEWHHAEHVAVAFWYLTHFEEEVAIGKIRTGIQKLVAIYGVQQTSTGGYHDTWTIFFSKLLNRYIEQMLNRELPLIQQMGCAIEFLRDFRELTKEYYSQERIMSWEARTGWQEPDLKPL